LPLRLRPSCIAQTGSLWQPMLVGAHPWCVQSTHGAWSLRRARLVHAAWRARQRFTGDLTMTRFTTCPPPWLKLYAPTPRPQWRRLKRDLHQSTGSSAEVFGIEVDKWLPTWIETPRLGSLAAQASHER
jgi:hypothetical protein